MVITGQKNVSASLEAIGIYSENQFWNLLPEALVEESIKRGLGEMTELGAIMVKTGRFTGRSPKDRFIVEDQISKDNVHWGEINMPISDKHYQGLKKKVKQYLSERDVFVRDAYACADEDYRLNLRLVTEYPWSNQFGYNMFLRPSAEEISSFDPTWNVLCAPGCKANPELDGTRQENFAIISLAEKTIIIGGTGYTGEIKKGIFSVLNFVLPHDNQVLSMHCSANKGLEDDTDVAVFFGLSGTGKTTLSADSSRHLIGDDEHGWSEKGIFNFEGGCYAKTIDLSPEKEPEIFGAIKHRAILENLVYHENTRMPDFENTDITQNTRVSYPIDHIPNAANPSKGGHPKNIFFLTADAFGILPPISKLTPGQAMYHFISGYTAKVAGTEDGVVEPQATFSACFGSPFLPLHPTTYADMLGERMQKYGVNVWLVNTGWTGGPHGTGHRINLPYTRAMIRAALNGELNEVEYNNDNIFGLNIPISCPNVPDEILNPRDTWSDKEAYDEKANGLAKMFIDNFDQFEDRASEACRSAAPVMKSTV